MSTKGQIVIPAEMREKLKDGIQFIVFKYDDRFLFKPADTLDRQMMEDIEFSKRIRAAYKKYDRGEFIKMDYDDFLKRLKNGRRKTTPRV